MYFNKYYFPGEVRLNKEDFQPPEGWKWDDGESGQWFIDPELR